MNNNTLVNFEEIQKLTQIDKNNRTKGFKINRRNRRSSTVDT